MACPCCGSERTDGYNVGNGMGTNEWCLESGCRATWSTSAFGRYGSCVKHGKDLTEATEEQRAALKVWNRARGM